MESSDEPYSQPPPDPLRLTQEQIEKINEALASIREFGEIRLVIQRGTLKYINVLKSHKAWDDDLPNDE